MMGQGWLGAIATATTSGQLLIRSTAQEHGSVIRLVIQVTDAGGQPVDLSTVMIADIKVGTSSQFVSLDPMPASILSPSSQANNAGYCTGIIQPGTSFSVVIANAVFGNTYNVGAVYDKTR